MIHIKLVGTEIIIKPTVWLDEKFGLFQECIAGSKYDPKRKVNHTIATKVSAIIDRLRASEFVLEVDPAVTLAIDALADETRKNLEDTRQRANGRTLYEFQKIGMSWLSSKRAAILSDEMGLGKTVQMLMALPSDAPVLVVCPKLAKGVWKREAKRWRPEYWVRTIHDRKSFEWPDSQEIVICNYDILPEAPGEPKIPGTVIVGDEIHATKNSKSKRTEYWRNLVLRVQLTCGRTYGLTGTPLLNEAPELWGILSSLGLVSESFGTWANFAKAMGGKKEQVGENKFVYQWGSPPDPAAVGEALKPVMLRRLRTEVLPELPVKTWDTLIVEIGQPLKSVCKKANAILGEEPLTEETIQGVGTIGEISEARKLLAEAKIPTMLEIVLDHEEQGVPLVIFSAHLGPIKALEGRKGWAIVTGETSQEDRTRLSEAFQAGKLRGFAGTIKAAGVAITLTRAYRCLFVDRDWTPALNEQAEDRVCRIGQDRGVMVLDLVADHALDTRLYTVLARKRVLIQSTIEQARQLEPAIQE